MKEKVIKRQKGCYLKLPEEFRGVEEVEVFPLREGYYLLSVPLGRKVQKVSEESVLKKLASFGFVKRSPSHLKKVLSKEEQEVLRKLVKAGKVSYIHNKKFREGIYIIEVEKKETDGGGLANALFRDGYIVLSGSRNAQAVSEKLAKQKNSVLGVRGFDGNYYVVTAPYFRKVSAVLAKSGKEVTAEEVAGKHGLSIDGCKAVLKLLSEKGEYLEKGGLFVRV